jgi:hypothetical protein
MDRTRRGAERSGDGAALLRARLHAGELTEAHVVLAARLGHRAAVELSADLDPVDWESADRRRDAVGEATALRGEGLAARVAADWAERLLPHWDTFEAARGDTRPAAAIASARAWAECPCADHRAGAEAGAAAAQVAARVYSEEWGMEGY